MTKNDIIGISLIPFILLCCIYHSELAEFVGILLNALLGYLG